MPKWGDFFKHYVLFFLLYYAVLYGLYRLTRWLAWGNVAFNKNHPKRFSLPHHAEVNLHFNETGRTLFP